MWSEASIDPALRRERLKPEPGGKDRYLRLIAVPFILAHLIVAGLDVGRFHGSRPMPAGVQAIALIGYTAGMALSVCAMVNDRFFSPVGCIQTSGGTRWSPRAPIASCGTRAMWGAILGSLFGGVVLGSWWSLVPLVPFTVLFPRRTALEDRMLRADLDGYAGYARVCGIVCCRASGERPVGSLLAAQTVVTTPFRTARGAQSG
jgi:protein-S-isoprenylcysteine O-methyltransferase Ste14